MVSDLLGAQRWVTAERPVSGSEDFSYVLEQVPGAFLFGTLLCINVISDGYRNRSGGRS